MSSCLLGLGSNVGDRARSLSDVLDRLKRYPGIELLRHSGFPETAPAGGPTGQDAYLNAAALVRTSLSPQALLGACQDIENELGRHREERWGPRTIDIDLLLYDNLVLNLPELRIPHPRMAWRRFVLESAAEIAAEMVHPTIGWTIARLLEHLNTTPWYLAIAGSPHSDKHALATELSRRLGARLLTIQLEAARPENYLGNPPSDVSQILLEFLKERARLLDRAQPDWALADRATVSDFWFNDWTTFARAQSTEPRWTEFMDRWRDLSSLVAQPRLVVMFHTPWEVLWKGTLERDGGLRGGDLFDIVEGIERSKRTLEQRATEAAGPVLWLEAVDREAALVELTAAVEAMR